MNILLHIPHASMALPESFYPGLRLSPQDLALVMKKHVDRYTDLLFAREGIPAAIAHYSRYYCDVERFADDAMEPMSKRGQGVVYTHAYDGRWMHEHDHAYFQEVMKYYHDYHAKLDKLALEVASKEKTIVVLDCHSYADDVVAHFHPEPYPDVCLGVEKDYTDPQVFDLIHKIVLQHGYSMAINQPFQGALIPNALMKRSDIRVIAFMLELNHRIYLTEDGKWNPQKAKKAQTMLDLIYESIRSMKTGGRHDKP